MPTNKVKQKSQEVYPEQSRRTKKLKSSTILFQYPSFLRKHLRTFIATIGITLTLGATIGLLSTYPQVLSTSTSSQVQASSLTPPPLPLDDQRTQEIQNQIIYWQQLVDSQPTYRDGFVQLAGLQYQLGNQQQVQQMLDQVKQIDPNWEYLEEVTQALTNPRNSRDNNL